MALPRNEQGPPRFTSVLFFGNPRPASRTTGLKGSKCLTFSCWRTTSSSGLSQRSRTPQRSRGPTGAIALTSCVISTPRLTCPATARFSHCSCWTSPTDTGLSLRAPTLRREMSSPLRHRLTLALNCTPPGAQTRLHSCGQILGSLGSLPALKPTYSRLSPLLRQAPTSQRATSAHSPGCT